eukprot:snap_masked-scaffold_1-processed-gene-22.38-mRNA-1 protein AED:1.00 eAED:1.00 QI:0/-1/0/0/-1/1/1/0/444
MDDKERPKKRQREAGVDNSKIKKEKCLLKINKFSINSGFDPKEPIIVSWAGITRSTITSDFHVAKHPEHETYFQVSQTVNQNISNKGSNFSRKTDISKFKQYKYLLLEVDENEKANLKNSFTENQYAITLNKVLVSESSDENQENTSILNRSTAKLVENFGNSKLKRIYSKRITNQIQVDEVDKVPQLENIYDDAEEQKIKIEDQKVVSKKYFLPWLNEKAKTPKGIFPFQRIVTDQMKSMVVSKFLEIQELVAHLKVSRFIASFGGKDKVSRFIFLMTESYMTKTDSDASFAHGKVRDYFIYQTLFFNFGLKFWTLINDSLSLDQLVTGEFVLLSKRYSIPVDVLQYFFEVYFEALDEVGASEFAQRKRITLQTPQKVRLIFFTLVLALHLSKFALEKDEIAALSIDLNLEEEKIRSYFRELGCIGKEKMTLVVPFKVRSGFR